MNYYVSFLAFLSLDKQPAFLLAVILLLLLLYRMDRRAHVLRESRSVFAQLCDVLCISQTDQKMMHKLLPRVQGRKPHTVISSLSFFEYFFKRFIIFVDRSRSCFYLKPDLLRLSAFVRKSMTSIPAWKPEKRMMPRFRCVKDLFVKGKNKTQDHALLMNISGGGVLFYTREPLVKGSLVTLGFDERFMASVRSRILDVVKKADHYIVRAQYATL